MRLKKLTAFIIVVVLMLALCPMTMAAEMNPIDIGGTDKREITVSGTSIQVSGTPVTLTVWYPDKTVENIDNGEELKTVLAYSANGSVLDGTYSFTFTMKPDDASGIYTVRVLIPGYSEPEEQTFTYQNIVRARRVLTITKDPTSTVAAILGALNTGLVDVNVEASEKYLAYGNADRSYIAKYVSNNRPTQDEELGFSELAAIIGAVDNQLTITRILTSQSSDRAKVKEMVEADHNMYLINDDDFEAYNGLSTNKQEQVISSLRTKILGKQYPEEVAEAFSAALREAEKPVTPVTPSNPGGVGGGGVSYGGNKSIKATSDDLKALSQNEEQTATNSFSDIETASWAKNAINILAAKGIINGKGDGLFCPNDNIKREEILKLLVSAFDVRASVSAALPYKDAVYGEWYYKSLEAANELKIVNGISSTEFGIGMDVTRQDLAVMLFNLLTKQGITLEQVVENVEFTDSDAIASYAQKAVTALAEAGAINGKDDGSFAPTATATRAEAAKMLYEVMHRLNLL